MIIVIRIILTFWISNASKEIIPYSYFKCSSSSSQALRSVPGGPGVRASCHLQARSPAKGRCQGTGYLLRGPLHRLLQEGRSPNRVIRRAATRGKVLTVLFPSVDARVLLFFPAIFLYPPSLRLLKIPPPPFLR